MPRYSDLLIYLQELQQLSTRKSRINRIWLEFFSQFPQIEGGAEVNHIIQILSYTEEFLFPLNEEDLNCLWQGDLLLEALDLYIPYKGFGLNWLDWHPSHCQPAKKPMVFLFPEMLMDLYEVTDEEGCYIEQWWQLRNRDIYSLGWRTDANQREAVAAALYELPNPLNALSVLYNCVLRGNANVFLDTCGYWDEYSDEGYFFWDVDDINELRTQWLAIEDKARLLEVYYEWFTPDKETQVIECVFNLEVA